MDAEWMTRRGRKNASGKKKGGPTAAAAAAATARSQCPKTMVRTGFRPRRFIVSTAHVVCARTDVSPRANAAFAAANAHTLPGEKNNRMK